MPRVLGSQKWASNPLEMELQSCTTMWMLKTNPSSLQEQPVLPTTESSLQSQFSLPSLFLYVSLSFFFSFCAIPYSPFQINSQSGTQYKVKQTQRISSLPNFAFNSKNISPPPPSVPRLHLSSVAGSTMMPFPYLPPEDSLTQDKRACHSQSIH